MSYMKNCNYTASEKDRCPLTTGYFSSTWKKKKFLVKRNGLGWEERWYDIMITGDRVCKKINLRGQQEMTKR